MVAEVAEQPTDDVWILYDTGLAVTNCPHGFQEEHGTRSDSGGPRCEAATRNVVTLGGAVTKSMVSDGVASSLRVVRQSRCIDDRERVG